ncbi:MAG: tyrosyl-tRNA synthetase [Thermomicrobiales bacterium]|jgi:tyrosyl-tRNA synthetase|nr:tyrosyl-tRNA synthetase [Thermomicrobiales bacterium]
MSATITQDAAQLARDAEVNPVDYLRRRGYVYDLTDEPELRAAFDRGVVTAYVGFDPTAPSLHVGHLLGIMMLASLQRFGHRPIALGGGGTALVGDPSGKTSTRALLTEEEIRSNLRHILTQFDRYLDFTGDRFRENPASLLMNNADWLLHLRYIEFLRDIGRHFSVNEMLAAETYKLRLEGSGLNFVEFNYRIVQAYDFLHLYRTTGCTLQMGGSDQWGNIVAGVDLIRRAEAGQAFGLVCPLLTTASGQKMGKTEGNSVWLDPSLTTPFDYYQYWINVDDADVEKLLKLYTFLPDEQIAELTDVEGAALREAKRVLAYESTKLTHGEEAAARAAETARTLFGRGSDVSSDAPAAEIPTVEISAGELRDGFTIAEAFVRAGLVTSRGEARRLAAQGGLRIEEERIEDVDRPFSLQGEAAMLRVGKKRHMRIVLS